MDDSTARRAEPGREAELARLISAPAGGNVRGAEAEFYRLFAPRVRLYGLRHLRDADSAADLVQEAILLTIQKLRDGELREPERVGSFVFGVCRMLVLELRRGQWRREQLLEKFGDDVPMSDPAIAPALDQERVANCLSQLPERERMVLLLTFYEESPAAHVAAQLNLSEGNVRVIRHRGLGRLRDCVVGAPATGARP